MVLEKECGCRGELWGNWVFRQKTGEGLLKEHREG